LILNSPVKNRVFLIILQKPSEASGKSTTYCCRLLSKRVHRSYAGRATAVDHQLLPIIGLRARHRLLPTIAVASSIIDYVKERGLLPIIGNLAIRF
jgi:hypothetical protein